MEIVYNALLLDLLIVFAMATSGAMRIGSTVIGIAYIVGSVTVSLVILIHSVIKTIKMDIGSN